MNKKVFVRDISKTIKEVKDHFIVAGKGNYTKKNGEMYIVVNLKDSTGTIEGRIWDRAKELGRHFDEGDVVAVTATPKEYNNKLQLTVTDIRKTGEDVTADDFAHFFSGSDKKPDQMKSEYFAMVEGLTNDHLKGLLNAFNSDKSLLDRFFSYPASTGVHHVHPGGLLEHSLSVAKMSAAVSELIGGDRDIVITGSILHDVGKIEELDMLKGFKFTDRGRLLGHITLGVMLLEDLIRRIDGFPSSLADVLTHIIVSHHGLEQWGSPKKPMFAEALIVHYLDNLDSRVMGVREHMRDNMADDRWSEFHRLYEAKFFKIS